MIRWVHHLYPSKVTEVSYLCFLVLLSCCLFCEIVRYNRISLLSCSNNLNKGVYSQYIARIVYTGTGSLKH